MSVSPPPRRTTRGDKFVGSSDEEFSNKPPQLRKKVYRKKKSNSESVSEELDSGVESRAASPKSPSPFVPATKPQGRFVQPSAARKDSTIHRQVSDPDKKTACGRRFPSTEELAAHFGGKDFGEYDNGSVMLVRQYGIGLFLLK